MILYKFYKWAQSIVKSRDMYGKTFTFTYKGEDEFKTTIGGVISIAIQVVLAIYAIMLLRVMAQRGDTNKSRNTMVQDLSSDTEKITLADTTFSLAFSVENVNSYNILTDSSLLKLAITKYHIEYDQDTNSTVTTSTDVSYDN